MVEFEVVHAPVAPELRAMTFPAYRHLLSLQVSLRHEEDRNRPPIQPLAVAAWVRERPVGLALAELPLVTGAWPELLSLYVEPPLRSVGIGSALLGGLEQVVAGRGFGRLETVYMTGKPAIPAFERVLAKRGWEAPTTRTLSVRFTVDQIDRFPWLNRYRLPDGFTIFPWRELAEDDREQLRRSQGSRHWIASDLQPWDHDYYGFEPVTSLGLRGPDGVVGWVINHAISETTLRFTCSYIRKDLGRRGRIVPVYSESLTRAKRTQFKDCTFVAPVQHPTMVRFVRKWMEPWVSFVGETRGSAKKLTAPEGAGDAVANMESSQPAAFDPQR